MAESSAFKFVVPQCEPGTSLRLTAPDGIVLSIPLPENILPGDEVHMEKAGGTWSISKALRGVAPSVAEATAVEWRAPAQMAAECAAPDAVAVRFETTKGPITVKVVPSWAPLGAKRFLQLVDDGYWKDIAIYRAINGGLLQFGVVQDTDPRSKRYEKIPDDTLVGIPYAEGVIGFAAAGPGTRGSTVCIMKADFRSQLGKGALGTTSTETPFGMVIPESMAPMHSIACLGDIPQCGGKGPDPQALEARGNEYIRSEFPGCDFILDARRV